MNNLEKELLRTLNEANEFMFDKGDWIKSFGIDSVLPSLAKYFARVAILKHAVDMDETESYSDEKSRLRDSTNDFINAFYKKISELIEDDSRVKHRIYDESYELLIREASKEIFNGIPFMVG